MNSTFKSLLEAMDEVSMEDATTLIISMLGGAEYVERLKDNEELAIKFGHSMHKLAKVGMLAVISKKRLVPLLMEGREFNDDTMLENDLVVGTS